jgi:hypothetical protein
MTPELSHDGRILTIHVPMRFQKRGGRKVIIAPEGNSSWPPKCSNRDQTLIRALARAHRWHRMLEAGEFNTVADLARAEKTGISYLSRILRLSLLAPDIKIAILDGKQPEGLKLADFMN